MLTFFHGWRRKAGCVALVMACVFMAAWVRSIQYQDAFFIYFGARITGIATAEGYFSLASKPSDEYVFHYDSFVVSQPIRIGAHVDHATVMLGDPWYFPYWSIVAPLTIFSAWLLLTKPRQAKSGPTQS